MLKNSITAGEDAFEAGLTSDFYQTRGGLNTEPLYALAEEVLSYQQEQEREAEIQAHVEVQS